MLELACVELCKISQSRQRAQKKAPSELHEQFIYNTMVWGTYIFYVCLPTSFCVHGITHILVRVFVVLGILGGGDPRVLSSVNPDLCIILRIDLGAFAVHYVVNISQLLPLSLYM